jgi:hypothetical protein
MAISLIQQLQQSLLGLDLQHGQLIGGGKLHILPLTHVALRTHQRSRTRKLLSALERREISRLTDQYLPGQRQSEEDNNWEYFMEFNKHELRVLKRILFYKVISISCMIFGCLGIVYGLFIFNSKTYVEMCLNNALIAASVTVIAMGYLMFFFLKIIQKFCERSVN